MSKLPDEMLSPIIMNPMVRELLLSNLFEELVQEHTVYQADASTVNRLMHAHPRGRQPFQRNNKGFARLILMKDRNGKTAKVVGFQSTCTFHPAPLDSSSGMGQAARNQWAARQLQSQADTKVSTVVSDPDASDRASEDLDREQQRVMDVYDVLMSSVEQK